jgi:hypothetical protein
MPVEDWHRARENDKNFWLLRNDFCVVGGTRGKEPRENFHLCEKCFFFVVFGMSKTGGK